MDVRICDTGVFIRHIVNIGVGAPLAETARADVRGCVLLVKKARFTNLLRHILYLCLIRNSRGLNAGKDVRVLL